MEQISTKLKKIPHTEKTCKCNKSMQMEFLDLSRNAPLLKLNFPIKYAYDQNHIGIQVDVPETEECSLQTCIDTGEKLFKSNNDKTLKHNDKKVDHINEIVQTDLIETNKEDSKPNVKDQQIETYLNVSNKSEQTEASLSNDNRHFEDKKISSTIIKDLKEEATNVLNGALVAPTVSQGEIKKSSIIEDKHGEQVKTGSTEDIVEKDYQLMKNGKFNNFMKVSVGGEIRSKKVDGSERKKLSIHMMPPIDIQRELVVQAIPMIVIDPSESLPEDDLDNNNIKYEVTKHMPKKTSAANLINNKSELNENDIDNNENTIQPQKDSASFDTKLNKLDNYDLEKSKANNLNEAAKKNENDTDIDSTHTLLYPPYNMALFESNASKKNFLLNDSELNNENDCHSASLLQNTNTLADPKNTSDCLQTNLNVDKVPQHALEAYSKQAYKPLTESEKQNGERSCSLKSSNTASKASGICNKLNEQNYLKELINEMRKNPKTEVFLKSYQVISNEDDKISVSQLELDKDVCKRVSSEGYTIYNGNKQSGTHLSLVNGTSLKKNLELVQKSGKLAFKVKGVDNTIGQVAPVIKLPSSFYSSKAVQCNETDFKEIQSCYMKSESSEFKTTITEKKTGKSNSQSIIETEMKTMKTSPQPIDYDLNTVKDHVTAEDEHKSSFNDHIMLEDNITAEKETNSIYKIPNLLVTRTCSSDHNMPSTSKYSYSSSTYEQNSEYQASAEKRGKTSVSSNSHDIPKRLSEAITSVRSSVNRCLPTANSRRIPETSELKVIHSSISNCSITSTDTVDIILEIDRKNMRKSQQLSSRMDLDSNTLSSAKRPSFMKKESFASIGDWVVTHDISIQTSFYSVPSDPTLNVSDYKQTSVSTVEKSVVEQDVIKENDSARTTCCIKLCRSCKKGGVQDSYIKSVKEESSTPTKSSLAQSVRSISEQDQANNEIPGSNKKRNVTIEEPIMSPLFVKTPMCFSERLLCSLAHKNSSPIESRNKTEMATTKNVYTPEEIVDSIKTVSDAVYKDKTGSSSQISLEDLNDATCSAKLCNKVIDDTPIKSNDSIDYARNEMKTVMAITVEQPNEKFFKSLNTKNIPAGDDSNYRINLLSPHNNSTYINHCKSHSYKSKPLRRKAYESSRSETATTTPTESISERIDEVLSDGEIKCKCSIGEVNLCPHMKSFKSSAQYLKKHPQDLIDTEFGKHNMKIRRQKELNSNWFTYYVSRSPRSDIADNCNSTDDSSGLIREYK